jgi:hypothetical protein
MSAKQLLSQMTKMQSGIKADLLDRGVFLRNLVFVAFVIKASEEILRVAIEHSEGSLREYFCRHLEEETGHYEWLKRDIQFAGIVLDDCAIPSEAVAMAGSQYYLAKHVHPAAVLGYIAALECFAMPLETVKELERTYGKEVCATLRYHAEHDVDHGADVLAVIDKIDPKYQRMIADNAVQTLLYIQHAIKRLA